MAKLREIVFDCTRAPELARFWAAVLEGYAVRAYDAAEIARLAALGFSSDTDPTVLVDGPGPSLCFQQVAAPKTAKNRVHLDVTAADRRCEVERLSALGASVTRETEGYTVMRDPEGNEFCVVER
ncbi:MAG TPA: VOC family protein [Myxococcota bacterium]|nr:VOC family protein [Myxococcota bacterium]